MAKVVQVVLGDIIEMEKPHPCGYNGWEVVKLGIDIGLKCNGCGHKVRLLRSEFDRRFRKYVRREA